MSQPHEVWKGTETELCAARVKNYTGVDPKHYWLGGDAHLGRGGITVNSDVGNAQLGRGGITVNSVDLVTSKAEMHTWAVAGSL